MTSINVISQSPTHYDRLPYETSTNIISNGNGIYHPKMNGNGISRGSLHQARNMSSSKVRTSPTIVNVNGHQSGNISLSSKQPLLDMSRSFITTSPTQAPLLHNSSRMTNFIPLSHDGMIHSDGMHEMLESLALMCLLSLLMAFLALFFLQRTAPIVSIPSDDGSLSHSDNNHQKVNRNYNLSHMRIISNSKEYVRVFQITVSLSTLTISLDLCCLFVCCIQFLSAVKLLKTRAGRQRTQQFLKKTSYMRIVAIGAFLISIPIFFTGVILFTFINFDEVPAIATSIIIGIGIVFIGCASVQNVYLWQCEKTKASQEYSAARLHSSSYLPSVAELSTLV